MQPSNKYSYPPYTAINSILFKNSAFYIVRAALSHLHTHIHADSRDCHAQCQPIHWKRPSDLLRDTFTRSAGDGINPATIRSWNNSFSTCATVG